jgi:hypothetical protein
MLEAKGYKPKVNVTDNQAAKYIKKKSHQKKMQVTTSGATQPSRECG